MRIHVLIGIDWGGTKIEGVAMEADRRELPSLREFRVIKFVSRRTETPLPNS